MFGNLTYNFLNDLITYVNNDSYNKKHVHIHITNTNIYI